MDRRSRFLPIFVLFLVFFGGVLLIISLPRESDGVGKGAANEGVAHSPFVENEDVPVTLELGYASFFPIACAIDVSPSFLRSSTSSLFISPIS